MRLVSRIILSILLLLSAMVSEGMFAQTRSQLPPQSPPPEEYTIDINIEVPENVPVRVNTTVTHPETKDRSQTAVGANTIYSRPSQQREPAVQPFQDSYPQHRPQQQSQPTAESTLPTITNRPLPQKEPVEPQVQFSQPQSQSYSRPQSESGLQQQPKYHAEPQVQLQAEPQLQPQPYTQNQTEPQQYSQSQPLPPEGEISPKWVLKSNLIYDATATVNLGAEFWLGEHISLDIPLNYNGWSVGNGKQWKHFMVQPEFRWWPKETFKGHFLGFHALYGSYDFFNLPASLFSETIRNQRIDGWLAGVGLSYGYRMNLGRHWALEATLGVGYLHMRYDKYLNYENAEPIGIFANNYLGPTKLGLSLIYNIGVGTAPRRTENKPKPVDMPVYVQETVPVPVYNREPYEPLFRSSFVVPAAEGVKMRSESAVSYIDYTAGRWEIVEGYKNNRVELQRIHDMFRRVTGNPDATITNISITGYTSPEGTFDSNLSLSTRRAQALKGYIRSAYGLPDYLVSATGFGEDWATLEEMVEGSDMAYKAWILDIIRNVGIFNGREKMLMDMAGGQPYRRMKAEFFPQLRRTECRIDYTLSPFTVERGKEILRHNPENLSLSEMWRIADTYVSDSDSFSDVLEIAARVYPDSDAANLNAAVGAMMSGNTASALRYLDRVKEYGEDYWNNFGILLWMQGDVAGAADSFAKAGQTGASNAAEMQKYLESVR